MAGGFAWQVSEPGAHLRPTPGGGKSVWLPPGTSVHETGPRKRGFIRVVTADGAKGWLDRREVQPPADGPPPLTEQTELSREEKRDLRWQWMSGCLVAFLILVAVIVILIGVCVAQLGNISH